MFKKALVSVPRALASKGFTKAFLYSFGSFLAGWAVLYFSGSEALGAFKNYAALIPLLNCLAVAAKQYFDELRN